MKKTNTKDTRKKTSPKNKKAQQKKKSSHALKILNKLMPYILTVSFVVLLFSLVGFLGGFGKWLSSIFGGLFSNFASYFIPFFMLYHAIMWYYDTKRKICTRRVICSFVTVISLSSLQHIITTAKSEELSAVKSFVGLYKNGVNGQGGGVVGGISSALLLSFGTVVAIIVIFLVLSLMLLQMFNITPASMIRAISNGNNAKKADSQDGRDKKKTKIKHRNVDIFDDDDDYDEDNLSSLALTDTTAVYTKQEKTNAPEDKTYKRADKILSDSAPLESSSQLKPYDKNKDYTKKNNNAYEYEKDNSDSKNDELIVTKNKLLKDEETPCMELNKPEISYSNVAYKDTDNVSCDDNILCEDTDNASYEDNAHYEDTDTVSYGEDDTLCEDEYSFYSYEKDCSDENENDGCDTEDEVDVYQPLPNKNDSCDKRDEKEDTLSNHLSDEVKEMLKPEKPKEELLVEKKPFLMKFKKDNEKDSKNNGKEEKKMDKFVPQKKKKHLFPSIDFLKSAYSEEDQEAIRQELQDNAGKIVTTLNEFNVKTKIVDIARGPTVTRYELAPEAGVRAKAIASHADDIALKLAAEGIRIECPIPGKSAVGIEVPNKITSFVYLKDLLDTDKFKKAKGVLTCAVGKSISGENIYVDIEKTPHLLVAGATGMGKSVCINSLLISMLYKATPDELRLILIDPKRVELSNYNGIPHLLVPVVCEPKKSLGALQWAVSEMDKRFEIIEEAGVRNLTEFNEKVDNGYEAEKMSRIVIVIDELADLKMTVPDIEGHITRLTQKARAAGIHIIIGTQRPSVDVITGLIKNNIPSRIAFRVPSLVDSRTILDEPGAEKLVSRGDMLVKIVGALKPVRVQGSFVTAAEIQSIIDFLKENSTENYDESVIQQIDSNAAKLARAEKKDDYDDDSDNGDLDPEFYNALKIAAEDGKISSSLLQRRLKLGFQRAARILDQMEECGFVGEANGSKPREVLISLEEYRELMMRKDDEE